VAGYIRSHSKF